jgi:hypothetical protein
MTVITQLQESGCILKFVQKEVDPTIPTYWSRHIWAFESDEQARIQIRFYKQQQNGRDVLFCMMPLGQVDALAGVPSFHSGITNDEVAIEALMPSSNPLYQRPPDIKRLPGIQEFEANPDSILLNPITLHAPIDKLGANGAIKVIEEDENHVILEIDLKKSLLKLNDEDYSDVNVDTGIDHRPFNATDGQHRKIACQLDEKACNMNVIVVLAPLGTTAAQAAEIFTDSNVQQEPLKELHMMFQRFLCKTPHRIMAKDFGDPEEADLPPIRRLNRLANRSAYELSAHVCKRGGPLNKRVQMMELPNRKLGNNCAITSKKFVKYARDWFLDENIFQHMDSSDAFIIFNRYIYAWSDIANTNAEGECYGDNMDRWDINTSRKLITTPYLTRPLPFESVMMLFPLIYRSAIVRVPEGESIMEKHFLEILTPLKSIEWGEFELIKEKYGLDKNTPQNLYTWLAWAITNYAQTNNEYEANSVWNPDTRLPIDCKPGRGFFSPPNREAISAVIELPETGTKGFSPNQEVVLWSGPLANVHRKPLLSLALLDNDGNVIFSTTNKESKSGGDLGFSVHRMKIPSTISSAANLRATIIVDNVNGEAQAEQIWPLEKFIGRQLGEVEPIGNGFPTHDNLNEIEIPIAEDGEPEYKESRFVLVKNDEEVIVPPSKSNSTKYSTTKINRIPLVATIVQCPRCSAGIDCNNNNCIGRTVDGYVWRPIV